MDWGSIGKTVGGFAPLIGGLLGGPAGAGAGALISKALGCEETPEAVSAAIQNDPNAFVKVKQIESDERTALAELALEEKRMIVESGSQDLGNVNETMRAEAKSEDTWTRRWRPFWGFCSAIAFFTAVAGIMFLAYYGIKSGKSDLLAHIPSLVTSLAMLFAIPGSILGVASWHRGMKQRLESGEVGQPGIMGAIANRLKR